MGVGSFPLKGILLQSFTLTLSSLKQLGGTHNVPIMRDTEDRENLISLGFAAKQGKKNGSA
uniref:Uncharacterized protein n=1 Tax=viral metagenome TaxID=1070528 RepID=A0A6M3LX72_9ZZZZ